MNRICTFSAFALLFFSFAFQSTAQDWQSRISPYGLRSASISASGSATDGSIETSLTLQCHPDEDGAISFTYIVRFSDKIKSFDFNEFEGPDAPAADKKLLHVELEPSSDTAGLDTEAGGWYEENQAFAFGFSARSHQPSELAKLIQKMFTGATSILVRVQDSKNPKSFLTTKFPLEKASSLIRETMQPCISK